MAMPKKRMSHKRSSDRRSHLALTKIQLTICANCKQSILPHRVCRECGYYKGEQVVVVKAAA
jgi:large subunit ribosomal protein L32